MACRKRTICGLSKVGSFDAINCLFQEPSLYLSAMAPNLEFFTVDAFTQKPFAGNPAAVIVLPASPDLDQSASPASPEIDDALRLKLAAEFNLSETAFATPISGGTDEEPKFELRWFTPTE